MNKYCYLSGRVNMKVCDLVVLHNRCNLSVLSTL